MAERSRESNDTPKDQGRKVLTPEVASVARRRIVKAGLTAPIILTLRSKPLFGQTTTVQPGCSRWMSAAYLSGSWQLSHPNIDPNVPTQEQCFPTQPATTP